MTRTALLAIALALVLAPVCAHAQDKPTIDQTIERIADLRAKRADLEKQEAAAIADLRLQVKALSDKLDRLGLNGPAPVPPVPPAPPPVPVDPLRTKLRAALETAAGSAGEKREWAKDLAALYRAAAKLAPDPAIATASALKLKLKEASAALIGPDALREVRQAVAVELAGVLPTTEADLTDSQRAAAAALFGRLAGLLDALAAE